MFVFIIGQMETVDLQFKLTEFFSRVHSRSAVHAKMSYLSIGKHIQFHIYEEKSFQQEKNYELIFTLVYLEPFFQGNVYFPCN